MVALLYSFVYAGKRANIRIPLFALAESCSRRCDVGKRYLSVFCVHLSLHVYTCIVFERRSIIALDTRSARMPNYFYTCTNCQGNRGKNRRQKRKIDKFHTCPYAATSYNAIMLEERVATSRIENFSLLKNKYKNSSCTSFFFSRFLPPDYLSTIDKTIEIKQQGCERYAGQFARSKGIDRRREDTKERSLRSYEMMVESARCTHDRTRERNERTKDERGEEVEEEDAGGCIPAR